MSRLFFVTFKDCAQSAHWALWAQYVLNCGQDLAPNVELN